MIFQLPASSNFKVNRKAVFKSLEWSSDWNRYCQDLLVRCYTKCAGRISHQEKRHEFFRTPAILEHKSVASKQTANPRGPIAGAFSGRHIRKFERALSMPALLTSSHDLRANGGNDDDDVDLRFGIRVKSVSGHAGRQAGVCQISWNRVERRHRRIRYPSHRQSSDNVYRKNAVGRDFQTRVHGSKIAR